MNQLGFLAGHLNQVDYCAIRPLHYAGNTPQTTALHVGLQYCMNFVWGNLTTVVKGIKCFCKSFLTVRANISLVSLARLAMIEQLDYESTGLFGWLS